MKRKTLTWLFAAGSMGLMLTNSMEVRAQEAENLEGTTGQEVVGGVKLLK